jgi:hypothetical protein
MQSKNWFFEAAMEAGHLQLAEGGFLGVRSKTASGTRVHLEATTLLAICYLREKRLAEAEPLIHYVLTSRNIKSEARRREFLLVAIRRFKEEGLLEALRRHGNEPLDPEEIQREAGFLVNTQTEDEMLADMGSALPPAVIEFLLKVDAAAKRGLPEKDLQYLPPTGDIIKRAELGRTFFGSFKIVLWRSICDPKSEIYKVWFGQGFTMVLNKKYFAIAISASLVNLGIRVKALAVSATALVIKLGLEVYCDRFRPEGVMDCRAMGAS